jgi:hypothetical protein
VQIVAQAAVFNTHNGSACHWQPGLLAVCCSADVVMLLMLGTVTMAIAHLVVRVLAVFTPKPCASGLQLLQPWKLC